MRTRHLLLCGGLCLVFAGGVCAAQETKSEIPPELRITRDTDPMPALEVVTVRKTDGKPITGLMVITMKGYLDMAYGNLPADRIIGAPSWMDSQPYVVNGKPSDELRDAMAKMTPEDRAIVSQMERRSMLRDLFKMKSHIETRQMSYWELVPAKGGLKIKEVPAAPPPVLIQRTLTPGTPPPPPPPPRAPGAPPPPGGMAFQNKNGVFYITARALSMTRFIGMMAQSSELDQRPIVNKTGFTGSFDMDDVPMNGIIRVANAPAPSTEEPPPSIFTTLQEKLGLKLVATKGPVEVVVIDSIQEAAGDE